MKNTIRKQSFQSDMPSLPSLLPFPTINTAVSVNTVLSLINAPGALQFFKRGMFIRGKFFNAKMQWLSLFTMTRRREI